MDNEELRELRDERKHKIRSAEDVAEWAQEQRREMNESERLTCEALLAEASALGDQEPLPRRAPPIEMTNVPRAFPPGRNGAAPASAAQARNRYRDAKTGEVLNVYAPGEPLTPDDGLEPYPFGRWVLACIEKSWDKIPDIRAEMGESGLGGNLVPDQLSTRVIDRVRALSVIDRIGVEVLPMSTDVMRIASIEADATVLPTGEGSTITASDLTLGSRSLTAKKLASRVIVSNELLEDAINGARAIEEATAAGMAATIDAQMLAGDGGSTELLGFTQSGSVQTSAVGGNLTWDELVDGAVLLWAVNQNVAAIVLGSTLMGELAKELINSEAAHYASPPAVLADVPVIMTTAANSGEVYMIGDRAQPLMGVRRSLLLEVSRHPSFASDQTQIRCTFRADICTSRPDGVVRLTGAT